MYSIYKTQGSTGRCPVCRRGPITENDLLDISKTNSNDTIDTTADDGKEPSLKLSSKLKALLCHLNQLRQEGKTTEKCVIFSQL